MRVEEHPLLRNFPGDLVASMTARARALTLVEGEILFDEADVAREIYLILEGCVVLEKRCHGTDAFVLKETGAGGHLGELAVLDGSVRRARARCVAACRAAALPAADFLEALEKAPAKSILGFFVPLTRHQRAVNDRFIHEMLEKEKLAVVGEMADSIMHDFRSPLTTVQLASDLLRREVAGSAAERYCDMTDRQIRHLQEMMEELLEFSRGTPRLKKARVSVEQLFRRFRENNELALGRLDVELVVEPAKGNLEIDSDKILRVLQNLFNNAIEAMAHRGTVWLSARRDGERHIALVLRDSGPGIPAEVRARLFEPFVTHGKERGTGMGLAIVRNFVEAHGGSVAFESEPGEGTEFRLLLPAVAGRRAAISTRR